MTGRTRTIVEMLADHELALKQLHEAYSARFPSNKDLWLKLAADEQRHSDWLDSLVSKVGAGVASESGGWPRPPAIESSLKYVREQTVRAKQGEVTLLGALSIAKDLENALLEKEFFKVADGTSPEVRAVLARLVAATERHWRAIVEALDAAKSATSASTRAERV